MLKNDNNLGFQVKRFFAEYWQLHNIDPRSGVNPVIIALYFYVILFKENTFWVIAIVAISHNEHTDNSH
jgi:hypothetical protein